MSERTSPISPRSPQIFADVDRRSEELFAFEGVDALIGAWRDGLTPDPALTVSEWADRHRLLSPRASAEPGRYRTDRTPYMRAIMDALSPGNAARRVVFMKAAQVGATEAGNNWIGYVIHHAPGPMLAVQPTVELAKRFSRQRIDPLIAESPVLRERVKPQRSRDAGNTVLSKEFPAGLLVITGANSAVGLRSMPARYLFLDEVDAYPPSADEEGDPVALAEARTRTFSWRSKVFLTSTPTIHGVSRIEREFEASDQRRYFVACPHCDHRQWLRFERLRWEKGQPHTAHYSCESCDGPIEEHHKTALMMSGEWRPTRDDAHSGTVGYHLSGLYSRWAGSHGPISPGCGKPRRQATRPSEASRTASLARPGSRPAKRRIGSGSTSGASHGASARCRAAVCSSRQAPTSRRIASKSRFGPGVAGSRAGSSTISSSPAARTAPRLGTL